MKSIPQNFVGNICSVVILLSIGYLFYVGYQSYKFYKENQEVIEIVDPDYQDWEDSDWGSRVYDVNDLVN